MEVTWRAVAQRQVKWGVSGQHLVASPFCGKAHEDANAHLQHFLEICSTFTIKGVSQEAIRLRLLPFSLLEKAKQWFYSIHNAVDT